MNITRKKLEQLVWKHKHRNFKGTDAQGRRSVMLMKPRFGACLSPIAELSDNDLIWQLPKRIASEHRLFVEPTIDRLRCIVREYQYQEIDGRLVDATTARAALSVHDKLNETNRERFAALPIAEMVDMTWRLVG